MSARSELEASYSLGKKVSVDDSQITPGLAFPAERPFAIPGDDTGLVAEEVIGKIRIAAIYLS